MEPKSIDRIYWDAAQIAAASEREAYLDRACAGDAELRRKVEQLLQARSKAEDFLESPIASLVVSTEERLFERPGTVIGPYKLLEQIGEGGFGVVFMAEQQQPLRRKVALKVLKPGMDTRQVVARFEVEQQTLALMDHPNIAKVFDGGATASGRPYFVMELVKGVPITEFRDQNHATPRQRLELFVPVCQAVQHAHQKGIIHRDLKPSNVLVTMHDTTPVVKVIDFGVAKALGQALTDKTLFTGFTQMIGTPLYVSPEQAGQSGLDIDTRSDIYSLGVLLYELLTGTTPFDKERLRTMAYDEIRRIIREEEPPKPSKRISTLGQAADTVSMNRQSDAKKLGQFMRGELDWIVMKALEKDRNRRYETASAFAADVQRYLNAEPVQACPASAWYRFRKFAWRNLHNFENVRGKFPPGAVTGAFPEAGITTPVQHGVFPFLLPYLEQQQLSNPYCWDVSYNASVNQPTVATQLRILQCPSAEPNRLVTEVEFPGAWSGGRKGACGDYNGIRGMDSILAERGWIDPVGNYEGALTQNRMVRITDITDGASNTILVAEDAGRPKLWRAGRMVPGVYSDGAAIKAFDPVSGAYLGTLTDSSGNKLLSNAQGIWDLNFGTGGKGGDPNTLYFSAGLNNENDGLFGAIAPLPGIAEGGAAGGNGGNGQGGAFWILSGTAGIRDMTLTSNEASGGEGGEGANGGDGQGGGIWVGGGVTVTDSASHITDNRAIGGEGGQGGTDGLGVGGGVYNLGTFLYDLATVIVHNHASTSNDDCFGC
jgi:serine/threonine protein kinase